MSQAPGSHFKMLITQPRSKRNQNGPRTTLMGPGGAVWEKKPSTKNLVRLSLWPLIEIYVAWRGLEYYI